MTTSIIKKSPRQELDDFVGTGRLRYAVESRLSSEAVELLLTVVMRYTQPRPKRKRK